MEKRGGWRWRLAAAMLAWSHVSSATIKADEEVVFFPTAAAPTEDGAVWRVPLHGWVFEPEGDSLARGALLELFREAFGREWTREEADRFRERAGLFLADNERGKRVEVRVGPESARSGPSEPNGHFRGEVAVPAAAAVSLLEARGDTAGWLPVEAVLPPGDAREFRGRVQCLPAEGLSVVSDLDDTVKVSEVSDRRALLANTFLRPFRAVPGMAELYRGWARAGAAFHYVSAGPWQLYPPLAELLEAAGFPPGSVDLREFRLKDRSVLGIFEASADAKRPAIEDLFRRFPRRRFVLVGDSGEGDPELYAALARAHPGRVAHVFIRAVAGEDPGGERFRLAFRDLGPGRWTVFRDAAEAAVDPASWGLTP